MTRKRNILTVLVLSSVPAVAVATAYRALCDQEGCPLAGNVALEGDTHRPAPASRPTPPADSAVPPQLLELRADLARLGRDQAQAEIARFRPLCDRDGYPLVGNVAAKGDKWYQPSAFCSDVRKTEQRS